MPDELETYRGFVYPWEMDHIGHLNVQFYVRRFDEASWHFLARLGVTPGYLREQRRGMVAREQRVSYEREVLAGTLLVIRTRLLEMRPKSVRYLHTMYDAESDAPVATMELGVIHIDADLRKSCPFPSDVVERGSAMLGERATA